jgi:hypothetical protein
MVVGLVSGTGWGLVETFVRSTEGGCGVLIACFVSNDSEVWAPRFDVSCLLMVAVVLVFGDEACTGSAEEVTFSTESHVGLVRKESEFNPPIHPRQSDSANNNAPVIIVTP